MIEERTPIFEELEKVFEERTNAYNAMKKNIASMWYCGHSKGSYSLSQIIIFSITRRTFLQAQQLMV